MRAQAGRSDGLLVKAFAGTYVVLLAFDCPVDFCDGLLGFAIRRTDHATGQSHWLPALKRFSTSPDGPLTTLEAPIQKFHWGDYTTHAGETYTYEVQAMRGTATALTQAESVILDVTCEKPDSVGTSGHAVHYNRSAASSQAFAREFPDLPAGEVTDPKARAWLSRGLAEALIKFIDDTQEGEGLHLFLYEFDHEDFAVALHEAAVRGVTIQLLHDGIVKNGKGPSIKADPLIEAHALDSFARHRTGSGIAISHNKFMVRTDTAGNPVAMWTGSTNFTDAAIYGQSNVAHAIIGPEPAGTYLKWHQEIWNDCTKDLAHSRTTAMGMTPVPAGTEGTTLVLSPRRTTEALTRCAELIGGAEKMVCFTAPFALYTDVEKALIAAKAQVYGLLNLANCVTQQLWRAQNTSLAASGAIDDDSVLHQWQGKLLRESMHHSGVHIHTKVILVDPLSDSPAVIVGSANFSNNSSCNNDENQLFIFNEREVADVYIGEFMRMFDHYYFRDHMKDNTNPDLDPTPGWSAPFFNSGPKQAAREAFF